MYHELLLETISYYIIVVAIVAVLCNILNIELENLNTLLSELYLTALVYNWILIFTWSFEPDTEFDTLADFFHDTRVANSEVYLKSPA